MKKIILFIILMSSSLLIADFIVPKSDPVYEYLEMVHILKKSNLNHFQYPLYYNEILEQLEYISLDRTAGIYRNLAIYHQKRLDMNYESGIDVAVWPPKKLGDNILGLFRKDSTHKRLITMTEPKIETKNNKKKKATDTQNTYQMYISGILGTHYDHRTKDESGVNRIRNYYGVESAGNFTENFGYYFMFRKGHYLGDEDFIRENPFLTWMDDDYYQSGGKHYQVDLVSEIDFKNPYLNLSTGYGSFDIGKTISSSIILNSDVTPYGYIKFNKKISFIEYNGITAQLIPERNANPSEFEPKGMAIQTLTLNTSYLTFGLGNSIIYGDRSFDLAYSTPLAIYRIMDNKYHGKDNGLFFGFGEVRAASGLNIYANFLFDDIRKDRFGTDICMSYAAYQAGLLTQMHNFPMEVGAEITAVGPSTYSHKSKHLTYMQDDMMLGYYHGSNLLSFAGRIRYHFARVSFSFFYENVQQGDIGNHPNHDAYDQKFLAENINREEYFKTNIDFRLIPELYAFARYEYNKLSNKEIHYIFTGIEFKY